MGFDKDKIIELLRGVVHPETGINIVESRVVTSLDVEEDKIAIVLSFQKVRDPFASKIERSIRSLLSETAPGVDVDIRIATRKQPEQPERRSFAGSIARVIAVASGKGGVGKSTVAANLAIALRDLGLRVGLLDADIYGPSQTKMFGCEGAVPEAQHIDGVDVILPVEVQGIKLMSIGFFVQPDDAMLWRGPMASNALRQFVHQTLWGELDFLLIDLPPGTGDVHLSMISEIRIDGAVIVSTPQQVAVADVARGVAMFRNPQVNIPVIGVVENMAWFTPRELPDNRYYIFGHGGAARYAAENGLELLGQIPMIEAVAECSDEGEPVVSKNEETGVYYRKVADRIVEKCR